MHAAPSTSSWSATIAALVVLILIESLLFLAPPEGLESPVLSAAASHSYHEPWKSVGEPGPGARYLLGDPLQQFEPWRHHMRQSLADGRVPYWNHLNGLGQPFLANPQTRTLYPLNWLHLIGDGTGLQLLFTALHLFLFGAGVISLLRRHGVGFLGMTVAGVSASCFGMQVLWMLSPHASAFAWFPWLLVAAEYALEGRTRPAVLLSTVATAMLFLAGHPETAFKSVIACWLFLCGRTLVERPGAARASRALLSVGAAQVIGLALAAPQILPFLEYLRGSESLVVRRAEPAYPALTDASQFLGEMVTWLAQMASVEAHGTDVRPDAWWLTSINLREVGLVYGGVTAAVLALLGLIRPNPLRLPLLLIGLVAAVATFRVPYLYDGLLQVPGFDVGANQRFAALVHFVLAVAAGIGLEQLMRLPHLAHKNRTWASVFVAIVVLGGALALETFRHGPEGADQWQQFRSAALVAGSLAFLALGAVLLLRRPGLKVLSVACFIAVLGGDVWLTMQSRIPWAEQKELRPETPIVRFMKENCRAEKGRILCVGASFPGDLNLEHDLAFLDSYSAMQPRDEARYLEAANTPVTPSGKKRIAWTLLDQFDRRLLNLASVRFLFIPGDQRIHAQRKADDVITDSRGDRFRQLYAAQDGMILERLNAQPRAWLVGEARHGESLEDLLQSDADPAEVVLCAEPGEVRPGEGEVVVEDYEAGSCTLQAEVQNGPVMLVLSDRAAPDWTVEVDGKPAEIHKVNGIFRGVLLPAGEHRVVFRAGAGRPLILGLWIAAAACVLLLVWLFSLRRSTS